MAKNISTETGMKELKALQKKAEAIKGDTEEFIRNAKRLSIKGVKDAKELIGLAKKNWKSVLGAAAVLGLGGAILRSKLKTPKPKVTSRSTKRTTRRKTNKV